MKVQTIPNTNYEVNPVSVKVNSSSNAPHKKNTVSFGFNPVIDVMDAMDRGGFAAAFILQDFLGMAFPRTARGLFRNSNESGEKNKGYARLVAIREILSGPSSFIIPAIMLGVFKKTLGRANNVPVNFIKGFNDYFENVATNNTDLLAKPQELKTKFFEHAVKNMLYSSTSNTDGSIHYLTGKELDEEVKAFTDLLVQIEKAPKKYLWNRGVANKEGQKYGKTLRGEFVERFNELRKTHSDNPSNKIQKAWFDLEKGIPTVKGDSLSTSAGTFINNILDYTNDAVNAVAKKFKPGQNISNFVESFGHKRIASRFLINTAMTTAVILFFTVIPKLYNSKDGKNPALAGLEVDNNQSAKEGK